MGQIHLSLSLGIMPILFMVLRGMKRSADERRFGGVRTIFRLESVHPK